MRRDHDKQVKVDWRAHEEQLEEGKRHVKMGVGVGAFGAGSLALIGATCPLCFVVAPALVGVGLWKSRDAKKKLCALDSQRAIKKPG